ncbi:MAG: hypothetical protein ACW976_06045, partial [Candidatus Ranarchaeia archaeon]
MVFKASHSNRTQGNSQITDDSFPIFSNDNSQKKSSDDHPIKPPSKPLPEKNPFGFDTYQRDDKLVQSALTIAQNHFELHYNAYYSSQKLVYLEVALRAPLTSQSQTLNWKEALHGFYNELKENGLISRRVSNQKLSQ